MPYSKKTSFFTRGTLPVVDVCWTLLLREGVECRKWRIIWRAENHSGL